MIKKSEKSKLDILTFNISLISYPDMSSRKGRDFMRSVQFDMQKLIKKIDREADKYENN